MTIQQLLIEAWNRLRRGLMQLIILHLLVFGVAFLLALILIIVLGVGILGNLATISTNPAALIGLIGPFAILIAVFVVIFIIISLIVQAGTILILGSETKYSLGQLLRLGLRLALPLFAVGLLTFLLAFPAFFLFLIPGLLVSLFLMFGSYGVVLGNRGILGSLRRSAYLVKSNFGYVFVRVLVAIGLTILIWVLSAALSGFQGGSIISWIVSMVFGWYVQSYAITLYKNLEETSKDKEKGTGLLGFVIIAAFGYLLAGVIIYSIGKVILNPAFLDAFKQGYDQTQTLQQNPDYLKGLENLENIDNLEDLENIQ